jgi:hypothetical protein
MTTTTDLTDRDRLVLALALDELRRRTPPGAETEGWYFGNSCRNSGGSRRLGTSYVTWHAQVDDGAFGYGWSATDTCPTCDEHCDRLALLCGDDGDLPDSVRSKWAGDTDDKLAVDEQVHIAEAHRNLVGDLNLLWAGDPALVCAVLRRHGLDAREPLDSGTTIAVLPAGKGEHVCISGHHHRYKPPPGTPP